MEISLLTTKELCKALKVGRSIVYEWIKSGMPHVKFATTKKLGEYRFVLSEVLDWHKEQNK